MNWKPCPVCSVRVVVTVILATGRNVLLEFKESRRHDETTWELEPNGARRWRGANSSEVYVRGVWVEHDCKGKQGRLF